MENSVKLRNHCWIPNFAQYIRNFALYFALPQLKQARCSCQEKLFQFGIGLYIGPPLVLHDHVCLAESIWPSWAMFLLQNCDSYGGKEMNPWVLGLCPMFRQTCANISVDKLKICLQVSIWGQRITTCIMPSHGRESPEWENFDGVTPCLETQVWIFLGDLRLYLSIYDI